MLDKNVMTVCGLTLWPGDKWRCTVCLEDSLPGRDCISKSMYKMTQYAQEMREAFNLEADGLKADEPRNRAEWATMIAAEIRKQGTARSKEVLQENGEGILKQGLLQRQEGECLWHAHYSY